MYGGRLSYRLLLNRLFGSTMIDDTYFADVVKIRPSIQKDGYDFEVTILGGCYQWGPTTLQRTYKHRKSWNVYLSGRKEVVVVVVVEEVEQYNMSG